MGHHDCPLISPYHPLGFLTWLPIFMQTWALNIYFLLLSLGAPKAWRRFCVCESLTLVK